MKNNKFSFFLHRIQKNNYEVSGKVAVTVTPKNNKIHIFANKLINSTIYNAYFLIKNNLSSINIQTVTIKSNKFGVIDTEINFPKLKYNLNYLTIAVLRPQIMPTQSNTLIGFRNKNLNWKSMLQNVLNKVNQYDIAKAQSYNECPEYTSIPKYDELIDSLPKFKLFSKNINGLDSVKINQDQFEYLNIESLTKEAKFCIARTIKECGYITFSRYIHNCKVIYIIGIPDQFVPQHMFFMKDIGAACFKCFDINKKPSIGDSGYWVIYI